MYRDFEGLCELYHSRPCSSFPDGALAYLKRLSPNRLHLSYIYLQSHFPEAHQSSFLPKYCKVYCISSPLKRVLRYDNLSTRVLCHLISESSFNLGKSARHSHSRLCVLFNNAGPSSRLILARSQPFEECFGTIASKRTLIEFSHSNLLGVTGDGRKLSKR